MSLLAVFALLPLALQDAASASTAVPATPERHPAILLLPQLPAHPAEAAGGESLLRRAEPIGDPRDWLLADDPIVRRFVAEAVSARATVRLDLTADGSVSNCAPEADGTEGYGAAICEALAGRATFLPPLDRTGSRLADTYILSASFQWHRVPPNRLVGYQLVPGRPPSLEAWPPAYGYPQMQVVNLPLLAGLGGSPEASGSPWAGALLRTVIIDGVPTLDCKVPASSGNAAFDRRACDTARDGTYRLPYSPAFVLFVQAQGRPQAVLPVHRSPTAPTAGPDVAATFATLPSEALDRVRLRLEIDAQGRPTQCAIRQSSGSDSNDLAACRLAHEVRFTPGEDVFGRPSSATLWSWSPR